MVTQNISSNGALFSQFDRREHNGIVQETRSFNSDISDQFWHPFYFLLYQDITHCLCTNCTFIVNFCVSWFLYNIILPYLCGSPYLWYIMFTIFLISPVSCPVVHAEKNLVIIISKKQAYSINMLWIVSLFDRYSYQRIMGT